MMLLKIISLKLQESKGAVAVIIAFALTALLGAAALVVDVGLLYHQEARLANAVDAAALAGVQVLPAEPGLARQLAESFALKNGVSPENLDIEISENNREINVQARGTVEHFFIKVLGNYSTDVVKSAGARVESIAAVEGAVPFSIEAQELFYDEEYVLKSGSNDPDDDAQHSGWFGALRLGGNGAKIYENNIVSGYQGEIRLGDRLDIENGNMSGPTTGGVNERISQCEHTPACTVDSYEADCPRLITIPVVQECSQKTVEVKGFAMFFLDRVDGQGNENNVWGKFVRIPMCGETTDDEEADFGIYSTRLCY